MNNYINDFPLLLQKDEKGNRTIYLDNAATTQKPRSVIEAVSTYYESENANPHRGAYDLSMQATMVLELARKKAAAFIGAKSENQVVFTKNSTEALNIIAQSYGMTFFKKGDMIVLAISEHHSNLVPWQVAAKAMGAEICYLYTNRDGTISQEEIESKITEKTKLVAVAHISNVTGKINPVESIIDRAHRFGAVVVVDGTQAAPHIAVDVSELDADFYVFSGHKMLAPMGTGILYGKEALLESMPPLLYGGDMIEYVEEYSSTYAPVPQKFEGGTQNVGGAAGLSAAIDYLNGIGMSTIMKIERELTEYMLEKLSRLPHLKIIGSQDSEGRIGVVPFVMEGAHPHDIATILNADKIAVRAGHHCAQPFHAHLGVSSTCRASIYLYNSKEDIDNLSESLMDVRRWLGYGAERIVH